MNQNCYVTLNKQKLRMKLNEKERMYSFLQLLHCSLYYMHSFNFWALLANEILDSFTIKNVHKKCINQCLLAGGGGKGKIFTHSIGLGE